MRKLNVAFAGFRHAHIFGLYELIKKYDYIQITGAWEEDAESIAAAKRQGVIFNYNTYDDVLNDDNVDIVAIGGCFGERGKMLISALRAGKHVIADKPLCTSLKEAEAAEKISRESKLKIGLMLDMRYNKNVLRAMEIIDSGAIGKINNIYFGGQHPFRYDSRPKWYFENGMHGGTINDIAIHGIDLVRRFSKSEIKEVLAARCWNCFATEEPEFKDSAQLMLKLTNGAGVIGDVSYSAPNSFGFSMPTYWEFKIWGTRGMLTFHANGDGVDIYYDGERDVTHAEGIDAAANYFDDFLMDIRHGLFDNTDSVLLSTKATLKIQADAD